MKNFIAVSISVFFVFIVTACGGNYMEMEMETWKVTVKVHNNSDYDVTDVLLNYFYEPNISRLEKDSVQTLFLEWEEVKNTTVGRRISIKYKINEEQFDVEHQEDAVWYKYLPLGHWEWREDDVDYSLSLIGERDPEAKDGEYYSLWYFTKGSPVDIYIDNESYRIEGGVFQKISIPLLPPWLRDDYPESYFEYDRPPRQ